MIRSLPWLPMRMSSPSPPLSVSPITPAGRPEASIVSSPPRPLTVSVSFAASAPVMCTVAGRPGDGRRRSAAPLTVMVSAPSVPLTMTDVGRAVAGAAAGGAGRSRLTSVDVGAGQVVDGDGVGAAEGVEVDLLDAVEVHDDVADVAGEAGRGCRWRRCRCSR